MLSEELDFIIQWVWLHRLATGLGYISTSLNEIFQGCVLQPTHRAAWKLTMAVL